MATGIIMKMSIKNNMISMLDTGILVVELHHTKSSSNIKNLMPSARGAKANMEPKVKTPGNAGFAGKRATSAEIAKVKGLKN